MQQAWFRFYAELNDFLPPDKRQVEFPCEFRGRQSVKHLIESLGVPHTEVDLILMNGEPCGFSRIVQDGDRVSVYPVFEALDVKAVSRVRSKPLRRTRFVADAHLGRLAAYLRMLGFDTLYRNDFTDAELTDVAAAERRILLTRDLGLLKHKSVTHGYFVRETAPRRQLLEVLRRFDLAGSVAPFSRCLRCNGALLRISRQRAAGVPEKSRRYASRFMRCQGCGKLYWDGSHYRRMRGFVERLLSELSLVDAQ
ncbi:MAG: Mut7-C RNAse domain-containing protein [Bryobacteraceae bacterium]